MASFNFTRKGNARRDTVTSDKSFVQRVEVAYDDDDVTSIVPTIEGGIVQRNVPPS
jgi:hypothetical protein